MIVKNILRFIYVGVFAFGMLSCTKESGVLENKETSSVQTETTFKAGSLDSKTSLGENKSVLWSEGDVLSVFDSELSNNKFTQSALSPDLTLADYTGTAVESETYYAVYPYRVGNASASAGVIDTYLAPDQFAVTNSFGLGANLSLGVSAEIDGEKYFTMQQVGAFIKFSFSGCSTITSICLKAIGGEKISGGVTATYSDGSFHAVTKNDGSALDEVTLYPSEGNTYIAPGTYYAVLLPVTLSSGLQILFTEKDSEGVEKIIAAKISSSIELVENTVSLIPSEIVLPDVSNPAWMAQETISVLFKEPWHLLDENGTASLPFVAPEDYSAKTVTVDGYSIGVNFGTKTPSVSSNKGFSVSSGTNNGWYFTLPAVSGKKLVKVEYYTSEATSTNNPCITSTVKNYGTIYGPVNNAGSAYSKYVWSLDRTGACWLTWYGNEEHKGFVSLNGFRAIYRDSEGPAKAVISASTNSYGAFVDQDVVLNGDFVSYDGTAAGYTYGFEYKISDSSSKMVQKLASAGESFGDGGSFGLRSEQPGEWTSVEGTLIEGNSFTVTLNSLARGQVYITRAWARVGDDGDKVYGEEEEIELLSKVSSGKEWKYKASKEDSDEFFDIWKTCSNRQSDIHNYNWEGRLADGSISTYKYGADGLYYETTSTKVEFKDKTYLKFGSNQTFSFISSESGTATISVACKSTAATARDIYVAVNGVRVDTFESSVADYSEVTSNEFSVNEGDKVSITINNNANLQKIAFSCEAQAATFNVNVDASSKADRNTVYNFTVEASSDLAWNVSTSDGTISKTSGTGNDTFTLTVPVNYAWGAGVPYTVTVSTSDERIAEGNRTQTLNLTQAQPTKVLFGCQWGTSFISAWNTAGFTADTNFTAQLLTAKAGKAIATGQSGYIRGNYTVTFIAGESGKAKLTFKLKIAASKTMKVYKNSDLMKTYTGTITDELETLTFDVQEGDLIKFYASGTNDNHYLYCNDNNPIKWELAEE